MENRVLNHNFGYGGEVEMEELNKLELQSIEDLKTYISQLLNTMFVAKVENFKLTFQDNSKINVCIEN